MLWPPIVVAFLLMPHYSTWSFVSLTMPDLHRTPSKSNTIFVAWYARCSTTTPSPSPSHHHHHHQHQHQHQHHCPPLPLQCRRGAQHLNHTTLYFPVVCSLCFSWTSIKINNNNNIAHYHPLVAILRRLPVSLLPLLHILPFAAIHCVYLAIRQYHTSKLPQYTYRSRYRAIIYPNTW